MVIQRFLAPIASGTARNHRHPTWAFLPAGGSWRRRWIPHHQVAEVPSRFSLSDTSHLCPCSFVRISGKHSTGYSHSIQTYCILLLIKFHQRHNRLGTSFFNGNQSSIWKGYVYAIKEVLHRKIYGRRFHWHEHHASTWCRCFCFFSAGCLLGLADFLFGTQNRISFFAHPVLHGAMIYMSFLQERGKLGLGISAQIDQEGIPSLLITFVCCHNSCDFKIMVQRYEQMRRLQWYKCGAAYQASYKTGEISNENAPIIERNASTMPTNMVTHTHVHGYAWPKRWVSMPKALGNHALHSWAKMPKALGKPGQKHIWLFLCGLTILVDHF